MARKFIPRAAIALPVTLCITASGAGVPGSSICRELKPFVTTRNDRLRSLVLYGDNSTGSQRFTDLEIDQGKRLANVELGCPASVAEPADPCFLEVHPSPDSSYSIEGMPLYLIRYRRVVYAVVGTFDEWPHTRHTRLLRLTEAGPQLTCTFVHAPR